MVSSAPTIANRRHQGAFADFWRRFTRNKGAIAGSVIIISFLLTASIGPWIAPYDPYEGSLVDRVKPPSAKHLLGTDEIGRDVLSRIIYGARVSFIIMFFSVLVALLFGIFLGFLGGYCGGITDTIVMRLMDILLAFPSIFLAIAIIAALGPGTLNVIIATGIYTVPQYARISRASVLQLKEMEFIAAARAAGESPFSIIFYHILPNSLTPLTVQTTLRMATVLLAASSLSFLGLGVQPPEPEWGAMLSRGRNFLLTAPHIATFPGLVITLVVMGFNLLGDGLRDALDPRLKD